jgi:hypothetical protein
MIVTVIKGIPQAIGQPIANVYAPVPAVANVGFVGVPGPQGPPGPAGTIVHVGPTAPASPNVNDLWVDTS